MKGIIIHHPNKSRLGHIILGSGHSLIIGHGPQLSGLQKLVLTEADAKRRIEQFGLFNVSSPNNATYYPDVTPEELTPKPEDYIRPIFRGLSEVVVRKAYDPIDFSEKGVLKASIDKIVGQTVYTNHETFVGNEVGSVSKSFWDEAYTFNGIHIPAGMNLELLIDGKSHPNIARGIMAEVPSIHSNSVNVDFMWEQSHPKMAFEDFRNKVGTMGADGKLIRRIANDIKSYGETSLVHHGADPFAQKVDSKGRIVNPKYALAKDNFSDEKPGKTYFFMDFKDSATLIDTETNITIPDESIITELEETSQNENLNPMKKSLILLLATLAGISLTDGDKALADDKFLTDFNFGDFYTKLEGKETDLTGVQTKLGSLEGLNTQITTLTTERDAALKFKTDNETALADVAKMGVFLSERKAELIRQASLVLGKAPDAAMLKTFNEADLSTVNTFIKSYETQLDAKFPLVCGKCNSREVARKTALAEEEGDDSVLLTDAQLRDKLVADRRRKSIQNGIGQELK